MVGQSERQGYFDPYPRFHRANEAGHARRGLLRARHHRCGFPEEGGQNAKQGRGPVASSLRHRTAVRHRRMTRAALLLGCIADDLTGATDLANTLARRGMQVVQTIGVPGPADMIPAAEAIVVALKSRTI